MLPGKYNASVVSIVIVALALASASLSQVGSNSLLLQIP
jgi:hypothetical protein